MRYKDLALWLTPASEILGGGSEGHTKSTYQVWCETDQPFLNSCLEQNIGVKIAPKSQVKNTVGLLSKCCTK